MLRESEGKAMRARGGTGRASHQQQLGTASLVSETVPRDRSFRQGSGWSQRSRRINPDTLPVQWVVVALVVMLGITSFIVSFRALYDVAEWAGIGSQIQWAVPVFIDGAILTYAMSVLVHRSRGESTIPSWVSLGAFTAMSVTANAAHALSIPREQEWQAWIGAAIAALAPIGVFAATEQLARLVVERPGARPASSVAEPVGAGSKVSPARLGISALGGSETSFRFPHRADDGKRTEAAAPVEPETEAAAGALPEAVADSSLAPETLPDSPTTDPEDGPAVGPAGDAVSADETRVSGLPEAVTDPGAAHVSGAETPSGMASQRPVAAREGEAASGSPEASLPGAVAAPEGLPERVAGDADGFAAWVAERVAGGRPITGTAAGEFLGVSDRTGRNRIKELKNERPEIFEGVS